ncbi:hypothetical protein AURDEDRAFT_178158 [Auricularia subglabra TFB-10046 SS5]|uniref:Uncharacterized protein n=1 Tax=Auricularia subglabra (strain TFB-10046 / SS5) TaxID=717982 RepID=J0D2A4_AURST|nr:hypothetical protein AURDEDRAFT_178158 [Auricularia subglabra TFB-10046 SS5]
MLDRITLHIADPENPVFIPIFIAKPCPPKPREPARKLRTTQLTIPATMPSRPDTPHNPDDLHRLFRAPDLSVLMSGHRAFALSSFLSLRLSPVALTSG